MFIESEGAENDQDIHSINELQKKGRSMIKKEQMGYEMNALVKSVTPFEEDDILVKQNDGGVDNADVNRHRLTSLWKIISQKLQMVLALVSLTPLILKNAGAIEIQREYSRVVLPQPSAQFTYVERLFPSDYTDLVIMAM
ncbi:hypothetical protein Tco_1514797 [Tanacetum coccineum]